MNHQMLSTQNSLDINSLLQLGKSAYAQGLLTEAEFYYSEILKLQPHAEALYVLGGLRHQAGVIPQAIDYYNRSLRVSRNVFVLNARGVAQNLLGQSRAAEASYREAIALKPTYVEPYYNLGRLLAKQGKYQESLLCSEHVVVLDPQHWEAWWSLANTLVHLGRDEEAQSAYERASVLCADCGELLLEFADLLASRRQYVLAIYYYDKLLALELSQDLRLQALWRFALILMNAKYAKVSLEILEQCLCIDSDNPDVNAIKGVILLAEDCYEEAITALDQALLLCPNHPIALWKRCLAVPSFYQVEAQIPDARNQFIAGLDQLIASTDLSHQAGVEDAFKGTEFVSVFYLAYQGYNDRSLQARFGQLLHEVIAAKFPQWAKPLAIQPKNKIRVGYISCFFQQHTLGYLSRGWLNLDDSFEIYVYNESNQDDDVTRQYQSRATRYCCFSGWKLEHLASQILADQIDVLIYIDIGMSSYTYRLAALRLAPVQCMSWGHPVTSGLPTIDYFLSSELMEPEDGDEHYCETLVRLPNLGFSVEPLPLTEAPPQGRQGFGLAEDALILVSCQSYFKYLPQYDWVFPEIVKQLRSANVLVQIIFINSMGNLFAARMTEAFRKAGIPLDVCIFSPKFSPMQFVQVLQVSDLFLDTFSWSGGRTTLQAIAVGLPVVTCPRKLMRGRHSYGILKFLGLEQQLAVSTPSEYVDLVVKLGCDPQLRLQMRQAIEARHSVIWNDAKAIEGLQEFYRQVVRDCPKT